MSWSVNKPQTVARVDSKANLPPVSFRELAQLYVRAGYVAPIPLPYGRKFPPPTGFTGHHNTQPPTAEQIQEWRETRGDDGIGFVLQDGWLLIDVDNYAKGEWPEGTGAATIAEAGERAGCGLPPGPKLRNRTDGSEKRLFWVPTGLKFRKSLGPCVDLVTPTHRYVNSVSHEALTKQTSRVRAMRLELSPTWRPRDSKPVRPITGQTSTRLPVSSISALRVIDRIRGIVSSNRSRATYSLHRPGHRTVRQGFQTASTTSSPKEWQKIRWIATRAHSRCWALRKR